jgi:hypothetical protein
VTPPQPAQVHVKPDSGAMRNVQLRSSPVARAIGAGPGLVRQLRELVLDARHALDPDRPLLGARNPRAPDCRDRARALASPPPAARCSRRPRPRARQRAARAKTPRSCYPCAVP